MTMASDAQSDAFGVRLGIALRFIKDPQNAQDRAPPVTSLARHPVTKLREAIRGRLCSEVHGRNLTARDIPQTIVAWPAMTGPGQFC